MFFWKRLARQPNEIVSLVEMVKGGIVLASGGAVLRQVLLPGLVLMIATGIGIVVFV